jgi:folate-binding protein YgfZ
MTTTVPLSLTEYNAVREGGCGVIDLTARGRIRVSGSEAVMFLNGLITNDMKALPELRSMPAVFPNVQGRLIAAVRVIRLNGETFLLDTEAATRPVVLKTIERFTMAGDFKVKDTTDETSMLSVQGKRAQEITELVLGLSLNEMPRDGVFETTWKGNVVTVIRASHTGEDGYDLIFSCESASELREALINAGCTPIGEDTAETLRIEAGVGRFGQDMDESNVITEANLDDAISFTKGCYIGQEIIIRIKHRGHVAKKLTGLLLDQETTVEPGAVIKSTDDKDIGRITSTTFSPRLGKSVALGYVRYEHLMPGTNVKVATEKSDVAATVSELPLVRGTWHEG